MKDTFAKVLLVIAPTLFWVIYYLPWNGSENWFPVLAMFYIAPVCLVLLLPILYFAIRRGRDISWWVVLAYGLAPLLKTVFDFLIAFEAARSYKQVRVEAKTRLSIFLILAPTAFWVLWFAPSGSGENYVFLVTTLAAQCLSVLSTLISGYYALKARRNLIWWLILAFDLSPMIWIFCIFPFTYESAL